MGICTLVHHPLSGHLLSQTSFPLSMEWSATRLKVRPRRRADVSASVALIGYILSVARNRSSQDGKTALANGQLAWAENVAASLEYDKGFLAGFWPPGGARLAL